MQSPVERADAENLAARNAARSTLDKIATEQPYARVNKRKTKVLFCGTKVKTAQPTIGKIGINLEFFVKTFRIK